MYRVQRQNCTSAQGLKQADYASQKKEKDINKVLDRNVHGVPNDKVLHMYNNFQYFDFKRLPYYIKKNRDRINFQVLNAFNYEQELNKMIVNLQIKNWL